MFTREQVCCFWFENDVQFSYIVMACIFRDNIVVPIFVFDLGVISLDGVTSIGVSDL